MSTRPRIVVGCDDSLDAEHALSWATSYARSCGGRLVLGPAGRITDDRLQSLAERVDLDTESVSVIAPPADLASTAHPASVLIEQSYSADLLVVGAGDHDPVTTRCTTHAFCPVVVVRHPELGSRGVVVGVDESADSTTALRWGIDFAELTSQPLTVLRCVPVMAPLAPVGHPATITYIGQKLARGVAPWLDELVAKELADRGRGPGTTIRTSCVAGDPSVELTNRSQLASVVVVGRRGSEKFRRVLMGSVSGALVHSAPSNVVVTPP